MTTAHVMRLALALAGELAEARLEDVFDAAVLGATVAHLAEQLGEVATRPEALLEASASSSAALVCVTCG